MQIKLTKKYFNTYKELIIYSVAVVLIVLSSINLTNYFLPKKVLSATSRTVVKNSEAFWLDFLETHPSYIPGWLEIGMVNKVKEIDPNYIIP